ncbi:hypothetical protein L1887_01013 [Cichorium endivia]|nr:hypothetical protein L1887_01013 [Cichorium endivia]
MKVHQDVEVQSEGFPDGGVQTEDIPDGGVQSDGVPVEGVQTEDIPDGGVQSDGVPVEDLRKSERQIKLKISKPVYDKDGGGSSLDKPVCLDEA